MPDIFGTVLTGDFTFTLYIICMAAALVCGVLFAVTSSLIGGGSKSFFICLMLLPAIVETVIIMVNGNIGTGIAVAGAFSLVRFRSVPGKAREIVFVFAAMTAGLACAAGYIGVAIFFSVITVGVTAIISFIPIHSEKEMDLRVVIPETLNYSDCFEDVFREYTKKHRLVSVKTANMGSLYKLNYKIELKDGARLPEFTDKLRCRNGNLEISISQGVDNMEVL
ncbi:MAG: DUF4956 domain-containing protein [Eubacteriales bacterium]